MTALAGNVIALASCCGSGQCVSAAGQSDPSLCRSNRWPAVVRYAPASVPHGLTISCFPERTIRPRSSHLLTMAGSVTSGTPATHKAAHSSRVNRPPLVVPFPTPPPPYHPLFLPPAPYDRLTCTPFQNAMCPLTLAAAALGASYTHAAFALVAPSTVTFLYVAVPFHGHTEVWAEGVKWAATRESGGKYTCKRENGRGPKSPSQRSTHGEHSKGAMVNRVQPPEQQAAVLPFPLPPAPPPPALPPLTKPHRPLRCPPVLGLVSTRQRVRTFPSIVSNLSVSAMTTPFHVAVAMVDSARRSGAPQQTAPVVRQRPDGRPPLQWQ